MKYLACLFLIFCSLDIANAQDLHKISVPLVKESPKIDSLISRIINIPTREKTKKDDSCFLLSFSKQSTNLHNIQGLHTLNRNHLIYDYGNFNDAKNIGYFRFKGYLIFVCGDKFTRDFFTFTESKTDFTFIKPTTNELFYMMRNYTSWAIIYRNGEWNYGVH